MTTSNTPLTGAGLIATRNVKPGATVLIITPGVRESQRTLRSPEQAATLAVDLAEEAARRGSFGVGGCLLDRTGRVIVEAVNAVVEDGRVADCTAHVERQLVDWYSAARAGGLSAQPSDLTIISSVDPCAMCAGAILRSGMNVMSVAEDESSGVHHHGRAHRMPEQLWDAATKRIALFGVEQARAPAWRASGALKISSALLDRADKAFLESVPSVNQLIAGADFAENCGHFDIAKADRKKLGIAAREFNAIVPSSALNLLDATSRKQLTDMLAGDGTALADENGNVIVAVADSGDWPARTSMVELIRAYASMRSMARDRFAVKLPHQRYCTVVKRKPHADPAKALLEFGALGSFLGAPRKTNKTSAICYLNDDGLARAREFLASLPPLYTSTFGLDISTLCEARPQQP